MNVSAAILGGGMLGRAVAGIMEKSVDARLWARRPEVREELAPTLPQTTLVDSLADATRGAAVVFFAVPASAVREVAALYGDVATGDQIVVHAVRGICPGEGFGLVHSVIREETCVRKIGVLGGPLYAPELFSGRHGEARPLAAVLASRYDEPFELIRAVTASTAVRVQPSRDVIGTEIAGAISNVSALAVGMAEALDLGETARGVLLTAGLGEAARLGLALGAQAKTFAGLAGIGDLIPRKVASTARHHKVGAALAKGASLDEALEGLRGEVEGINSASAVLLEAARRDVELPLVSAVDAVCHGRQTADAAIESVLARDLDLAG